METQAEKDRDKRRRTTYAKHRHHWVKKLLAQPARIVPSGHKVAGITIAEHFINVATGTCWASHETIAEKCGLSPSSVKQAIANLVRRGFLKVHRRGNNQTNVMSLTIPTDSPLPATDNRLPPTDSPLSLQEHMKEPTIEHTNTDGPDSVLAPSHDATPPEAIDEEDTDSRESPGEGGLRAQAG